MGSERIISILMDLGLIIRKSSSSYWLKIPEIGGFIMDLRNGRKEVAQIIKRTMYKEILLKVASLSCYSRVH